MRLGAITIIPLEDGAGPFFSPRTEAFPTATAEHWRRADAHDPEAADGGGGWRLRFRCFAIRLDDGPDAGRTILVDAGIGPADSLAASWAPVPGRLPAALAAAGVAVEDVDTVVLTHLHTDHIGWAVVGGPYFPRARYLVQRADATAFARHNPAVEERVLAPLRETGQLWLSDGAERLAPAVRAVPTPGHSPGHQSVLVTGGGETVLVAGDLLVHAVQLIDPQLPYAHEMDPTAARESRTALLADLLAGGRATLATPHLSAPFTPLPLPPGVQLAAHGR
ncbi:MAG TPA: MBL fold metallo-hydrolase [Pilimelia sp.]|nr:MBL fold metallo-hydrolase [Pilimelia sp.]